MSNIDIIEEVMNQCDYPEEDIEEEFSEEYLEEVRKYEAMTEEEQDKYWKERREKELKRWEEIWK